LTSQIFEAMDYKPDHKAKSRTLDFFNILVSTKEWDTWWTKRKRALHRLK